MSELLGVTPEPKKQKVKNKRYRQILDERVIKLMHQNEFIEKWKQIPDFPTFKKQLKYFTFLLYWTGARPAELLGLQAKDFIIVHKGKSDVLQLNLLTLKRGLPRKIRLKTSLVPHARDIWDWANNFFPDFMVFYKLISDAVVRVKRKDGIRVYRFASRKVYHWVLKYFDVPPYFFRHNRFSDMAEKGADMQEIKYFKGAKKLDSVAVYIELTGKKAEDLSKYLY